MVIEREYTKEFIQIVKEALENSEANGFDTSGNASELAEELMDFVCGFEHENAAGLTELIEKIRNGII